MQTDVKKHSRNIGEEWGFKVRFIWKPTADEASYKQIEKETNYALGMEWVCLTNDETKLKIQKKMSRFHCNAYGHWHVKQMKSECKDDSEYVVTYSLTYSI